jgi:hypothetical protein
VGSLFINAMQSVVFFIGFVFCTFGVIGGYKMYSGELPPVHFPMADEPGDTEMLLATKKAGSVPITPDVFHS